MVTTWVRVFGADDIRRSNGLPMYHNAYTYDRGIALVVGTIHIRVSERT